MDAISVEYKEILLGVTRISPERLIVTEFSNDLEGSVIVGPKLVNYQGECVSFTGLSPTSGLLSDLYKF